MRMRLAVVFLLSITPAFAQTSKTPAKITYIRAGHLFAATSDGLRDNVILVIEGDRIKSIEPSSAAIPSGAAVIDLHGATVLPGLIDCHTHLTARADRYDPINYFKNTPFTEAFSGVRNAHATLLAGFTTVRDVGSPPFAAVDLRNAITDGYISGPRIVASGPPLSITGGHGDINGFSPETQVTLFPEQRNFGIADGVEQVRQTVRAQVKYGVDVVKVLATGGVLSQGDSPGAPQYSFEELKTAADEAHAAGRKVAAHAHGAEGIKRAILAGIDSIEHASLANEEDIQLAKQHGTYFVMDIYNDDYILGKAIEFGLPKENVEKERMVGRLQRENFQKAFQAGVKMAFGTDAGVYPHGDNAKQFKYMVQFGMSPAQAIKAATVNAADLIGHSKDVGTLEPGKFADLIAVPDNPLENIRALETVGFVMKGGVVYKDKIANSPVATLE